MARATSPEGEDGTWGSVDDSRSWKRQPGGLLAKSRRPSPTGPSRGASSREVVAAPAGQRLRMGRCAPDVAFVWRAVLTLGLVLLYYCFSIGITFYNKWLTKVHGGRGAP